MEEDARKASLEIWTLITSINKIWSRQAERRLVENGLSIMEFRILKTLNRDGPQPMIKLAEANMITQGWVTNIVDKLEEKGLVRRVRSQSDRRVINIITTEKGREFYNTIKELHEAFIINTMNFMSEKDREDLKCVLARMEKQLRETFGQQIVELSTEQKS